MSEKTSFTENLRNSDLDRREDNSEQLLSQGTLGVCDGPTYTSARNYHLGTLYNFGLKSILSRVISCPIQKGWDMMGLPNEQYLKKLLSAPSDFSSPDISNFFLKAPNEIERNLISLRAQFQKHFPTSLCEDPSDDYRTLSSDFFVFLWERFSEMFRAGHVYGADCILPHCSSCKNVMAASEVISVEKDVCKIVYIGRIHHEEFGELEIPVYTHSVHTYPFVDCVLFLKDQPYSVMECLSSKKKYLTYEGGEEWLSNIYKSDLKKISTIKIFQGKIQLSGHSDKVPLMASEDPYVQKKYSGFVHMAYSFGELDLEYSKTPGAAIPSGRIDCPDSSSFGQIDIRDYSTSPQRIIDLLLQKEGLLWYEVSPLVVQECVRCGSRCFQMKSYEYFFRLNPLQNQILALVEGIEWIPLHNKTKQIDWTKNIRDWAFSRNRLWGIPIPILRCSSCGRIELFDDISWSKEPNFVWECFRALLETKKECIQCKNEMQWIRKTFDVWFDSGVSSLFQRTPLGILSEGPDQSRGWFHSVLSVHALLGLQKGPQKILVHGWIKSSGKLLSKRKGNQLEEFSSLEAEGIVFDFCSSTLFGRDIDVSSMDQRKSKSLINLVRNTALFTRTTGESSEPQTIIDYWISEAWNLRNSFHLGILDGGYFAVSNRLLDLISNFSRDHVSFFKQVGNRTVSCCKKFLKVLLPAILCFFPSLEGELGEIEKEELLPECSFEESLRVPVENFFLSVNEAMRNKSLIADGKRAIFCSEASIVSLGDSSSREFLESLLPLVAEILKADRLSLSESYSFEMRSPTQLEFLRRELKILRKSLKLSEFQKLLVRKPKGCLPKEVEGDLSDLNLSFSDEEGAVDFPDYSLSR